MKLGGRRVTGAKTQAAKILGGDMGDPTFSTLNSGLVSGGWHYSGWVTATVIVVASDQHQGGGATEQSGAAE